MEATQLAVNPIATLVVDVVLVQWYDEHWYKVTFLNGKQRSFVSMSTVTGGVFAMDWLPRYRGRIGNDQADQEMQVAGHRGTRVHHAIYTLCRPGVVMFDHPLEINVDPDHRSKVNALIGRCKDKDIPYYIVRDQFDATLIGRYKKLHAALVGPDPAQPLMKVCGSEMNVYSIVHECAGTLDNYSWVQAGPRNADDGTLIVNIPTTGYWILDYKTGNDDESHLLQTAGYLVSLEESKGIRVEGTIIAYLNTKVKKGLEGVKLVLRTRQQVLDEDFPDFLRAKALWHRGHPNAEPKVAEFEAIMYLPDITEAVPSGFFLPNDTAEKKLAEEEVARVNAAGDAPALDSPSPSGEAIEQGASEASNGQPPTEELNLDGDTVKRYRGSKKGSK